MAYGNRLAAEPEPLVMNIYLANSLLLPEEEISLFGGTYTIAVDDNRIDVPASVFKDKELLGKLVATAEFLAENAFHSGKERDRAQLLKIFQPRLGLGEKDKNTLNAAINIYNALLSAKKANRNGTWAYILANTFAPVFLKNQCDMILGNPPWLVFRDIVANDYQDEIMELARRSCVLPKADTLFTHLELAAVFVGNCLNYFLKPEGRLAFVMPRSCFVADQHHKIREGKIQYMRLEALWDWGKVRRCSMCQPASSFAMELLSFLKLWVQLDKI